LRRPAQEPQIGGTGLPIRSFASVGGMFFRELSESKGGEQIYDSSAVFGFNLCNPIFSGCSQELQIRRAKPNSAIAKPI
jgi:hypothetical protein